MFAQTKTSLHNTKLPLMPAKTSEITVVMSCYNDEAFVQVAINSVQQQQFSAWEMIVINDGSTDCTGAILDELAANDSRIHVLHQPNIGLTKSLIKGCSLAKTEFIARQDADDISLPGRFKSQIQLLKSDLQPGLVSCAADYIGPNGEFLSTVHRPVDSAEATRKLLDERLGPPAHGTLMFRKSIYDQVGGYRPQFYYAQDSDLWMRMAEVSQIAYVQESGYQFRWHESSITGSGRSLQSEFGRFGQLCRKSRKEGQPEQIWLEQAENLRAAIVERRKHISQNDHSPGIKNSQLSMAYFIACQLVANKDYRARSYLRHVLRHQPWHMKAWVRLAQSLVSGQKRDTRSEEQQSC